MGREKKITVKGVANKSLRSKLSILRRIPLYPLYAQVTYDRKTTKFPVIPDCWVDENMQPDFEGEAEDLLTMVKEIAEVEKKRVGEFTVRGFSDLYKIYLTSISWLTEIYLSDLYYEHLRSTLSGAEFLEFTNREMGGATMPIPITRLLRLIGTKTTPIIESVLAAYDLVKEMDRDYAVAEWYLADDKSKFFSVDVLINPMEKIMMINELCYTHLERKTFTYFV